MMLSIFMCFLLFMGIFDEMSLVNPFLIFRCILLLISESYLYILPVKSFTRYDTWLFSPSLGIIFSFSFEE